LIVDFDDYREEEHRLDLLHALKDANPEFKCTLFAIPGRGSDRFWESTPDWCEIAVHGYLHPTPVEAANWSRGMIEWVLDGVHPRFVRGFKAPGWQISDDTLEVLRERDYWVADQPYNDWRRPEGLRVHRLGDGDHWHGHIPDVCGNGIAETFQELCLAVRNAGSFELISDVVERWVREPVAA
jgi:peptidoglycan/xylan/chitin deacetylase (PgdA/CDA1 family)